MTHPESPNWSRRRFVAHAAKTASALALARYAQGCATGGSVAKGPAPLTTLAGPDLTLRIAETPLRVAGQTTTATTVNGSIPGPLIRLKEGEDVWLRVENSLPESSSIHWHGLLLPPDMDGVPGISFDGIAPGAAYDYRFRVRQSGTYWYHSHSGFQEQTGVYGPMVIDPAEGERYPFDREYVIVLSDWTFEDPERVLARLKKYEGYYNQQRRTLSNFHEERQQRGFWGTVKDRLAWDRMRMDATDLLDVTATTYTHLFNGHSPEENWTGLFQPGERVRLRFVNASAITYFDVRIPGLPMTVIEADGSDVLPVETDELRIAVAETYDVIVTPENRPYTVFAETMDRSGYTCGTLATRMGQRAEIPKRRRRPLLGMVDMGMKHEGGMHGHDGGHGSPEGEGHGDMQHGKPAKAEPGPARIAIEDERAGFAALQAIVPAKLSMSPEMLGMVKPFEAQVPAGCEPEVPVHFSHDGDKHGAGNISVATVAESRLLDPGMGLRDAPWRVLTYSALRRAEPASALPTVTREIELHLTGNMERYMWSFDGEEFHWDMPSIKVARGERVRLVYINDTMMSHPIHLHGMFVEMEVGACERNPLKHTIDVKPGQRVSWTLTGEEVGRWAFHCHLLYHMESGMFRVFEVTP